MRETNVQAIILKHQPMGDVGLLVTVFTKEQGKMRLLVKGAKRMTSKLAAAVQPGGSSFLTYTGKGQLPLVIHARQDTFYLNDVTNLSIISTWYVMAEWLLKTTVDDQPLPVVFDLTDRALKLLPKIDPGKIVLWWKLQLLDALGWGMQVIAETSDIYFNFLDGSFVDAAKKSGDSLRINSKIFTLFKELYHAEVDHLLKLSYEPVEIAELDILATRYLSTIIERDLKADRFRAL